MGAILFEMLTLRVPFEGSTFMAVLSQHMFDKPVAPSRMAPWAQIPPELDAIVLKALQKEPRHRFASMHDMAAAIEAVGSGTGAVEVIDEDVTIPTEGVATTFASPRSGSRSQSVVSWR